MNLPEQKFRIILESPPPGVDFALQKGSGFQYETVQKQRSALGDLVFDFSLAVRPQKDAAPKFSSPFVQGPPQGKFIYIDIGTAAGQSDSCWSRRLKVPLRDITWQMLEQALDASQVLEARIVGTAKDGSPSCATPKPFNGWKLESNETIKDLLK